MRCNWCAASAVTKPSITYAQRPEATPEAEISALASTRRARDTYVDGKSRQRHYLQSSSNEEGGNT